jgi:hypothetical protein
MPVSVFNELIQLNNIYLIFDLYPPDAILVWEIWPL